MTSQENLTEAYSAEQLRGLDPGERRELLKAVFLEVKNCRRCPLWETRTNAVFGSGDANAELMFVGEAPGANEDKQGLPFVGRAGKLLEKLLSEIGMSREEVFIGNVLKSRPPNNRDPHPSEIEACQGYLWQQIGLIQPTVICTLGNFATKLLRGDQTGITQVHGRPEIRILGSRAVHLLPIYHPAAALYTPKMLDDLREDFKQLPGLLAQGPPPQPEISATEAIPEYELVDESATDKTEDQPDSDSQLDLFG